MWRLALSKEGGAGQKKGHLKKAIAPGNASITGLNYYRSDQGVTKNAATQAAARQTKPACAG